MNYGKYVFAQLTEFLPRRVFDAIVEKYEGNNMSKHFTCRNQLLAMIFGQLAGRDSFRDLIAAVEAHSSKSCHLGFGQHIPAVICPKQTRGGEVKFSRNLPIT